MIRSPFITTGPVPESMFFGRETELRQLVEKVSTRDFAIVGNRRIGKTSLLQMTSKRLEATGRIQPFYFDCSIFRGIPDFFSDFQRETKLILPTAELEAFAILMADLCQQGKMPVFLLDEMDALLRRDSFEPLISTWRHLSQIDMCHFIFCGYTRCVQQINDSRSVFFDFAKLMHLGYLAPEVARLLFTKPLEALEINIDSKDALIDQVLAITSGHPHLIQYVGSTLVDAANQRKGRPTILLDDLKAFLLSRRFANHFLDVIWGCASPLEKLITLVAPSDEFTIEELKTALQRHKLEVTLRELQSALAMLCYSAVLDERNDGTYCFIPRAFREILRRTMVVDELIEYVKEEIEIPYEQ